MRRRSRDSSTSRSITCLGRRCWWITSRSSIFRSLTVVSPDAGGVERARFFAKKMEAALAIVDKRRTDMNVTEVMHVIGDVHGRTCLILDDIIDTAGTLVKTVQALMEAGAAKVYACASHAVLSGEAISRISKSALTELVVTNTIPLTDAGRNEPKIKVLSIARADRASDPVDTRRDFRQQTVFIKERRYGDRSRKNSNSTRAQSGGKNDARRVRKTGMIPAAVYGAGQEPLAGSVDPKAVGRRSFVRSRDTIRFSICRWVEHPRR